MLHTWANPDGTQKIENTGPLTTKRMETVDEEFLDASLKFIEKANADGKPFFVWWNSTRMHVFTHLKKESEGKTGLGVYPDGMVEHDGHVGKLLDKLDELGIADNTIVMYSTDNGAECLSWPDGGWTPFRGEKDTNWEGGWRVPCAIRWPGVIKPGTVSNEIFSHTDMLPTLLAVAGEPDIVEKLKKGHKAGNKTFKVHIDGYNLLPFLKGEVKENPRKGFFYWSDDGDLMALRYENWKLHFMEQRAHGFERLAGAVRPAALPEALQSAERPLRAGRRRRDHVLPEVVCRPHVPARTGPGSGRPVPQDVRGIPAAPEAEPASASTRRWRRRDSRRKRWSPPSPPPAKRSSTPRGRALGRIDGSCGPVPEAGTSPRDRACWPSPGRPSFTRRCRALRAGPPPQYCCAARHSR